MNRWLETGWLMRVFLTSFAVTAGLGLAACGGGDNGSGSGASESMSTTMAASTTSDTTTGESTTSQPTSTDASATDASATDANTASPTTGDVGGEIKEDCDATSAALAQVLLHTCGCAVEEGTYPDVQTCLTDFGEGPEAQELRMCECEQVAADPSNASSEACWRSSYEAFLACITPLNCSEKEAIDTCSEALFTDDCGVLSKKTAVQIGLQCYGNKPFMCESGETVLEAWICDGLDDCMDGSDEKNC